MKETLALLVVALGSFSATADTIKLKVTVLENIPTTTSYDWQVSGKDTISCYSSGCTSYFTLPNSGTATVSGAVLKLLLPDGRIVIAECDAKPDVAANLANALAESQASTVYRNCRRPEANSTIDAEFNRSQVKLFIQAPSIDGTGKVSSETYYIEGVLQPNASQPANSPVPPAPPSVTVTVNNIPPQLKAYAYPSDGFSASYPSEPHLTKVNAPTTPSREVRLYFAQDAQTGLFVLVDEHDPLALVLDSDAELESSMNSFVSAATAHLISKNQITLGVIKGVEFEAESSIAHFSARFYLVDKALYKTAVAAPIGKPYTDTTRFLDSFQLIPRAAVVGLGQPTVSTGP
jgi:hypothetical protein